MLEPESAPSVLTADYGTGQDYVAATWASDGSTVMAYLPSHKEITVDLTRITGMEARAWWFNPREGVAELVGDHPTTANRLFRPSTYGDWVLVLDTVSLDRPAPGTPP